MTEKQMKKILKKIYTNEYKLLDSMIEAQKFGLIKFSHYDSESPSALMTKVRDRLRESMAKQVFDIVKSNL